MDPEIGAAMDAHVRHLAEALAGGKAPPAPGQGQDWPGGGGIGTRVGRLRSDGRWYVDGRPRRHPEMDVALPVATRTRDDNVWLVARYLGRGDAEREVVAPANRVAATLRRAGYRVARYWSAD